jgi:hypothetical protein
VYSKISALLMGALWLAAPLFLEAQVSQITSITGVALSQSAQSVNGNTPTPSRTTITTESFLRQLALDEFAAQNYGSNFFPEGAKLSYLPGTGFQVVDRHNNVLLNVSAVLSLQAIGTNNLGSQITAGIWTTVAITQLASLTYDSTQIGGRTQFTVSGLGKTTTRYSVATASGNYTEFQSFSLQNGAGEGLSADGMSIVLTGFTITMNGSGVLYNGLGVSGVITYLVMPPIPPIPLPTNSSSGSSGETGGVIINNSPVESYYSNSLDIGTDNELYTTPLTPPQ